MTVDPIALPDLLEARTSLVQQVVREMPDAHRRFLVSFERGNPDWALLGLPKVDRLPAVKWRIQNLDSITKNKRADLVAQLEQVLGLAVTPAQLTLAPEKSTPTKARRRKKA
jgi:hypothetical protein